ncbi:CDP-diacylglycerol diphosphatase [Geomesophilobacter sediminis]|uniref:CDP-diacylglycerol pyrophosphatase n=1 Tax=Geomesophilobacter sediminis TaxID=2798584 RepID=A0A8J7LXI0_9BACT|nr:CDP-diacylglycerol diphosphatase [Geomesophilobacter sediminis]MBJ6723121.1 CDP-diacylglycerol diphosphatase [Geomesophilobacter sediminis]
MKSVAMRRAGAVLILMLTFAGTLPTGAWAGSRDFLWKTVSTCLDPSAVDYCGQCSTPRAEKGCAGHAACGETLQVLAEANNYVAFADRKMCGCPEGYFHALAIPRAKVTGVEDPHRPEGIWCFAWELGRRRIGDETVMALVVNPRLYRSQDQLHVHVVRLKPDARQRFTKLPQARVPNLDQVWRTAREKAEAAKFTDYGVLVASSPDGGYLVVVDPVSPEKEFTEAYCR